MSFNTWLPHCAARVKAFCRCNVRDVVESILTRVIKSETCELRPGLCIVRSGYQKLVFNNNY